MYKISLELSSSQDVVNVFHMPKLYSIIWQCPEEIREYHSLFTCPLLSTTSGYEFVWGIYLLETYGGDHVDTTYEVSMFRSGFGLSSRRYSCFAESRSQRWTQK